VDLRDYYEHEGNTTCRYSEDQRNFWQKRYHSKRFRQVRRILLRFTKESDSTFIDIGCGAGEYLAIMNRRVDNLYGCDLARSYLFRASQRVPEANFCQVDVTALPFGDQTFDTVLCSEVIEHIPDLDKALIELFRVSRKRLILTTPNRGLRWKIAALFGMDPRPASERVGHLHVLNVRDWKTKLCALADSKIEFLRTKHFLRPPVSLENKWPLAKISGAITSIIELGFDFVFRKDGDTIFLVMSRKNPISPGTQQPAT